MQHCDIKAAMDWCIHEGFNQNQFFSIHFAQAESIC